MRRRHWRIVIVGSVLVVLALVFFLFMLFSVPAVKLWPIAHRLPTDENRHLVMGGRAIVMAMAGFIVAGQFVTLSGLEIPYYMAMVGVMILKDLPVLASAANAATAFAGRPTSPRPGHTFGTVPVRPGAGRAMNMR